jgi:prophage regulatory protein
VVSVPPIPLVKAQFLPDLHREGGGKDQQLPARTYLYERRDSDSASKSQIRVLTYRELKSSKGIPYTRQHLDRLEKAGAFPRRIRISAGRIGWIEHEIDAWLKSKAYARPD